MFILNHLFLQIADLESEDGKKDTMVDVVFKKALKEFRINIFNSYSTALAVSPVSILNGKNLWQKTGILNVKGRI